MDSRDDARSEDDHGESSKIEEGAEQEEGGRGPQTRGGEASQEEGQKESQRPQVTGP
jgi:hypothetical protein